MTKAYFCPDVKPLVDKEAREKESFDYIEMILSEIARHHRNPDAYNKSFKVPV